MEKNLIKLNKEGSDREILEAALQLKEAVITAKRGTSHKYYHFIDNGDFYSFSFDSVEECLLDDHTTTRLWYFNTPDIVDDIMRAGYHSFKIVSYIGETKESPDNMGECRVWLSQD